jgi:hypothetical protein
MNSHRHSHQCVVVPDDSADGESFEVGEVISFLSSYRVVAIDPETGGRCATRRSGSADLRRSRAAVTVAGQREIVKEYSDTLLIFLLKGARPER